VVESLRSSTIELVITRHEQAAGFMAATYGRLTGKPGVCITTLGPGALNLTTAAAYAHVGAMPMVMITGQKGILTSRQARFQIVDIVAAMKPLTKLAHRIVATGTIPTLVREAFRVAEEERPGPVLLELPEDIAAEKCDRVRMIPPHPLELPSASPAMLDRAAGMIIAAKRPLLMLGAATIERRAGAVRPPHAHSLLHYPDGQRRRARRHGALHGHGRALGTGLCPRRHRAGRSHRHHRPRHQREAAVHDARRPPCGDSCRLPVRDRRTGLLSAGRVVGDMGRSLGLLADRLDGKLPHAGALLPLREGILNHLAERATEDRWTPQRIVHDVRQVMPADGIVALDNGMYKIWFARNYRTRTANTLLLDNALATMGAGLPSAMMAAMLHPGRRVLAVCGDGGFMMNSQELETAVRRRLDLVVLVLVDGAFGMIRWKQAVDGFADSGMTFGNPDFAMYARAYGAHGHNVREVGELVPTLEAAFRAGGVHLIAVPIDYSENKRVLVDELRDRMPAGQNLVHPRDA
jgi:acetolactate synthase-1/2/3 large subunit